MATDYFTTEHFKLLNKWKGFKYDKTNPEQLEAYQELSKAYAVTEAWAELVKEKMFPGGSVDIRKRPTNQANNFEKYNWAKIYPSATSPEQLAYTVGISGEQAFFVKIDTVGNVGNARKQYEAIRDSSETSIVATLPAQDGLEMSLAELVDWTIARFQEFKPTYDEMVAQLGFHEQQSSRVKESDDDNNHDEITHEPKNIIYYGPPGTGKTYAIQQLLKNEYVSQVSDVSVDEWRTNFIAERIATLTWWEVIAGSLYELKKPAKVMALTEHRFLKAKSAARNRTGSVKQTLWGTLQHHTSKDSETVHVESRHAPAVFDKTTDSDWVLSGNWQEECADVIALVNELQRGPAQQGEEIHRYEFVTFHQSFGYEEFIEGLRPILNQESEQVAYEIRSGAFLRLCERACLDPAHAYAMVIDEINRGNTSKIFGELISLIELDKREGRDQELTVTLPYSGTKFSVPANVDIIGSMNTADRSLALVDTALRRRFEFIAVMPQAAVLKEQLDVLLSAINKRIEALYDRDHMIGHAYFTPLLGIIDEEKRFSALQTIFKQKIIPLLEEYFFEDWQKIRLVLGDNQKTDQATCFISVNDDQTSDLEVLFGSDHGLDEFSTKTRYAINEAAFANSLAYQGIYQQSAITA
jgi:5-methylcytosine-specific restriction enzyme B